MIIIGELINSTRKSIKKAIEEKDTTYIQDIALKQVEAGADYIDVNAGAFIDDETEKLIWLVETVQMVVDTPLTLDSPRAGALEAAIKVHKGVPMLNSISLEKVRYENLMPLLKKYKTKVLGLCMSDEGMPKSMEDSLKAAKQLISSLEKDGISLDDVFLDPLVKPISVNDGHGLQALEIMNEISGWKTGVHLTCGLTNISHGLPQRYLLNQAFLILAMGRGLDSVIIDPLDKHTNGLIKAANALLNNDPFCKDYLKAVRLGKIGRN